jgi:phage terminase small subunit
MPILPNARHEAFAHGLARGLSATEAYVNAGYKDSRSSASRLSTNANIVARVAELQQMAAQGVVIDRQWVIARLTENVERAMQIQQVMQGGKPTGEYRYDGAVANKALELLGKEIGMFVERSENVNTNYNISDEPLTADEWEAEHTTH